MIDLISRQLVLSLTELLLDMAEIRLHKLLKYYNIGLRVLIDYLRSEGIDVDNSPNAKVGDWILPKLDQEFGGNYTSDTSANLELTTVPSVADTNLDSRTKFFNLKEKRTLLIDLRRLISQAGTVDNDVFRESILPEYERIISAWQSIGELPEDQVGPIEKTYARYISEYKLIEAQHIQPESFDEDTHEEEKASPIYESVENQGALDEVHSLVITSISFPGRVVTESFGEYKAGVLFPEHITSGGQPVSIEWLTSWAHRIFEVGKSYNFSVISSLSKGGYAVLGFEIGVPSDEVIDEFDSLAIGDKLEVSFVGETPNYYIVDVRDLPFKGVVLRSSITLDEEGKPERNISLQLAYKGKSPFEMLVFVKPVTSAHAEETRSLENKIKDFLSPEELDAISEEDLAIVSYLLEKFPTVTRDNCKQISCDIYCRLPENSPMQVYLNTHPAYLEDRAYWVAFSKDRSTGNDVIVLFHSDPTVVIEMSVLDDNQFVVSRFDSNSQWDTRNAIRYNNRKAKLMMSSRNLHFVTRYEAIPVDFSTADVIDMVGKLSDFNTRILHDIRKAIMEKVSVSAEDYTTLKDYLKYQKNAAQETVSDPLFIESSRLSLAPGTAIGENSLKIDLTATDFEILLGENEDSVDGIHVAIVDEEGENEYLSGILHSDGINTYLNFVRGHVKLEDYLNGGLYLRRRANTKHLDIQISALDAFVRLDSLGVYQDLINGRLSPNDMSRYNGIEYFNPVFRTAGDDNNQTSAVRKALANENVLLIQGPPGTGKTTIIVEIINQLAKERKKVLVCSQAHAAVANIYERLDAEHLDILRLDDLDEVDSIVRGFDKSLYSSFLENNSLIIRKVIDGEPTEKLLEFVDSLSYANNDKEITSRYRTMHKHVVTYYCDQTCIDKKRITEILSNLEEETEFITSMMLEAQMYRSKDVVMGTCIGIGMNKTLRTSGIKFDTVIIDEAGKANLAETIVPMQLGDRFVLVGDHRQLPPYIDRQDIEEYVNNMNESESESEAEEVEGVTVHKVLDRRKVVGSLSNSLFADFYEHPLFPDENKVTLNYQFRMNPEIGNYISTLFYNGVLKSGAGTERQSIYIDGYPNAVTFVDTTTKSYDPENDPREAYAKDGSIYNEMEVRVICNDILPAILPTLSSEPNLKVGIITPYKAQYFKLRSKLAGTDFADAVHTIDSIQGSEFDIVLFSFVRSFPKTSGKTVGFLDDMRRLNVSLSRAKKKLILVGNLNTLQSREAHNDYGIPGMVSPVDVFESIATNVKRYGDASDFERFMETNPEKGQIYEDVHFEKKDGSIVFDIAIGDRTMRFSMPDRGHVDRQYLDVVYFGLGETSGKPVFYPADLENFAKTHKEGDEVEITIRKIQEKLDGKCLVLAEAERCIGAIDSRTLPANREEITIGKKYLARVRKIDLETRLLLFALPTRFDVFVEKHHVNDVMEGTVQIVQKRQGKPAIVVIAAEGVSGTLDSTCFEDPNNPSVSEGDCMMVKVTKILEDYQKVYFSRFVRLSERMQALHKGYLPFRATVVEYHDSPSVTIECEDGERMEIDFPLLWLVSTEGESYDIVGFPNGKFALNSKAFFDFMEKHRTGDRVLCRVVNEDEENYYVEAEGLFGTVSKRYLDSIEKDLNYGKDYMLKVFRFDEKHKNVQFGI